MQGTVLNWCQTTEFASGYITDEGNNWYSVGGKDVEADSIGRVFLEIGEPVLFDPAVRKKTKSGTKTYKAATNVKRPQKETGIDPKTHRELVMVRDDCDFMVRRLGGLLTVGFEDRDGISPGMIFEVGVREAPGFKTWRAVDLKWIANSEEDVVDWDSEASLNV
jgi:hypothetical protein